MDLGGGVLAVLDRLGGAGRTVGDLLVVIGLAGVAQRGRVGGRLAVDLIGAALGGVARHLGAVLTLGAHRLGLVFVIGVELAGAAVGRGDRLASLGLAGGERGLGQGVALGQDLARALVGVGQGGPGLGLGRRLDRLGVGLGRGLGLGGLGRVELVETGALGRDLLVVSGLAAADVGLERGRLGVELVGDPDVLLLLILDQLGELGLKLGLELRGLGLGLLDELLGLLRRRGGELGAQLLLAHQLVLVGLLLAVLLDLDRAVTLLMGELALVLGLAAVRRRGVDARRGVALLGLAGGDDRLAPMVDRGVDLLERLGAGRQLDLGVVVRGGLLVRRVRRQRRVAELLDRGGLGRDLGPRGAARIGRA